MVDGRPLPPRLHPGAPVKHRLSAGEETEWRKWTPKVGDVVLVELANEQVWPGKVGQCRVTGLMRDHRSSAILPWPFGYKRSQLLPRQDI